MSTAADRFSRLEKVAIFLIALGEERTREILNDVDLDTVEQLNAAIKGLGLVSAEEKASVMLEFAHFFYEDKPIPGKPGRKKPVTGKATGSGKAAAPAKSPKRPRKKREPKQAPTDSVTHLQMSQLPKSEDADQVDPAVEKQTVEEQAILRTLEKLRQRLDPGKIDWGKAGYDFGEGFKGPTDSDRS